MTLLLWAAAVLVFGIVDVAMTAVALRLGAREQHPIGRYLWERAGVAGLVAGKLVVFALAAGLYGAAPADWRIGVPIGLIALGGIIMAWNADVLRRLGS